MRLQLRDRVFALLAVFVVPAFLGILAHRAGAQSRPSHAPAANSGPQGDAVIDGLKFHPVGGFIQVVDIANSISAGTIIVTANSAPVFAAMPGYDARLRAAYTKYAGGDSAAAPPASDPATTAATSAGTPAPAAATATPIAAAPAFDAASKTVTLSGGRSVTFLDDNKLTVQMPGPAGTKTYDLEYHGKSMGGFFKTMSDTNKGRVGGSVTGSGVAISLEAMNGIPGGPVYDTARGIAFGNSGEAQAKLCTAAVREASTAVKPTQPKLANSTVVQSLLSNNLGL